MNLAIARRLAANTAWSVLAHIAMRGGLVVAFMILSHRLTSQEFAELSYFHLALGYVAAFSTLGLGPTTIRTFAATGSPRQGNEAGAELTAYAFIAVLAFSIAWLWGEPRISGMPGWTFAAVLMVVIAGAFPQAVLNGFQDFRSLAFVAVLAAALVIGCSLLAVGKSALPIAVYGVAGGHFLKLVGETAGSTAAIWDAGFKIRRPARQDINKIVASMSWLGIAGVANAVGMWGLASWMRTHLDNASFGTFAVGLQWYAIGMFVAANITRALMPMQVHMASVIDVGRQKLRLLALGGGLAIIATIAMAAGAFLFRDLVATFYDSRLIGLGIAIAAFATAAATAAPLNIIANYAIAEGRDRLCAISSLAWLATVILAAIAVAETSPATGAFALALGNIIQGITLLVLLTRAGLLR